MEQNSHLIKNERCPQCAKLGKDRHNDNLAIYSDGHSYCYSCGYTEGSNSIKKLSEKRIVAPEYAVTLPPDVVTKLPYEAKKWLEQYEISELDIKRNLCMWSETWSRLIFPYFNDGELLAWQGRYIPTENSNPRSAKWFSQGKIHEIIHPLNVKDTAVIVEDIVSAIKVSKITGCIPLFGSEISQKHILRLKHVVGKVWYWLDPDKRSESVSMARKSFLMGLASGAIFSDRDPKELSYEDIRVKLQEHEVIV